MNTRLSPYRLLSLRCWFRRDVIGLRRAVGNQLHGAEKAGNKIIVLFGSWNQFPLMVQPNYAKPKRCTVVQDAWWIHIISPFTRDGGAFTVDVDRFKSWPNSTSLGNDFACPAPREICPTISTCPTHREGIAQWRRGGRRWCSTPRIGRAHNFRLPRPTFLAGP